MTMAQSHVPNHNFTMSVPPMKGSIPHDMKLLATSAKPGSNCWGLSLGQITASQHCFSRQLFVNLFKSSDDIKMTDYQAVHLSTSLEPKTSTVGSASTWKRSIRRIQHIFPANVAKWKVPNLESPEPANRKLSVKISNDRKSSSIAQVDKVVIAVKVAKGGKGLCNVFENLFKIMRTVATIFKIFKKS